MEQHKVNKYHDITKSCLFALCIVNFLTMHKVKKIYEKLELISNKLEMADAIFDD